MVIWAVVKFTVNLEKLREDIKMAVKKIAEVFITEGFKLLKPVYDDFVKLYNKEKLKGNLDDVIGAKPPTPKPILVFNILDFLGLNFGTPTVSAILFSYG